MLWIAAIIAIAISRVRRKIDQSIFDPFGAFTGKSPSGDQPLSNRIENQIGKTVQAKFLKNIVAMSLDGRNGEIQKVGNLTIALTGGQALKYFSFPKAQKIVTVIEAPPANLAHVILDEKFRNARAEIRVSRRYRPNGSQNIGLGRGFQKIPSRSRLQGPEHVAFVGVHADDYDSDGGKFLFYAGRRVGPVEARHAYVEQSDLRFVKGGQFDRFVAVRCFGYHVKLSVPFEQRPQSPPDQGMVIGDQYPDSIRHTAIFSL